MKIAIWILLIMLFLGTSACSAQPTDGPKLPAITSTPTIKPQAPAASSPQSATPSSQPQATVRPATAAPAASPRPSQPAVASPAAAIQRLLGDQPVRINAQELMTVSTPTFTLTGQAPAGAVVSVNDDFIVVSSNRSFSFAIELDEGPNLVEFIASNAQGHQISVEIVLVYDPSP